MPECLLVLDGEGVVRSARRELGLSPDGRPSRRGAVGTSLPLRLSFRVSRSSRRPLCSPGEAFCRHAIVCCSCCCCWAAAADCCVMLEKKNAATHGRCESQVLVNNQSAPAKQGKGVGRSLRESR